MNDPLDIGDKVKRISVDIGIEDFDLILRNAAYRNALAEEQTVRLKRRWTKKSMVESMLAAQCNLLRKQLAEMVAAIGPLPEHDDEEAMAKYAKRANAWSKNAKQ